MKLDYLLFVCLFSALPLDASTAVDANPYRLIGQKNSFRLMPLMQLQVEAPRPSAKIVLQGTTTVLGRRQALLALTLPDNIPEIYVILGEGERTAGVEVVQINHTARTVQVLNYAEKQELSLNADTRVAQRPHQQIQLHGRGNVISSQRQIISTIQIPAP